MAEKKFSMELAQIIAETEAAPKVRVRIAQDEHVDTFSKVQVSVSRLGRSLEDLTDEPLVELLEEGDMLETLTPLEHELLVRLGARLELEASA